jgi:hypothetical protein
MKANHQLGPITNVARQPAATGHNNGSPFSSQNIMRLICDDGFSEVEKSIKESGKSASDSPKELTSYFTDNRFLGKREANCSDCKRNQYNSDVSFWIYNDLEPTHLIPRFTNPDSSQESWLKSRPENPSKEFQKLKFHSNPIQLANLPEKHLRKGIGCSCVKSKCIRLHCKCFRVLGFCSPHCGCIDCFNEPQFETERGEVIRMMKKIYPHAFKSKIIETDDHLVLNSQGFRCKTGCSRNYCGCFKNKIGCSPICKCRNCINKKVEIEMPEVRRHYDSGNRSKDKIVIRAPNDILLEQHDKIKSEDDVRDMKEFDCFGDSMKCRVIFRDYKKKENID